jgi:hypothetical protein
LLLVFAGLKARMAIEPDIDRSLLADALSTLLSAIDSPGK